MQRVPYCTYKLQGTAIKCDAIHPILTSDLCCRSIGRGMRECSSGATGGEVGNKEWAGIHCRVSRIDGRSAITGELIN